MIILESDELVSGKEIGKKESIAFDIDDLNDKGLAIEDNIEGTHLTETLECHGVRYLSNRSSAWYANKR